LVTATHDVTAARRLESIAVDVSRGKNIDLASATQLVAQVEVGRYKGLISLGIATKEQVAGFKSSTEALDLLSRTYGGQAAAYAETFAGKQKVVGAELKDMGASLGEAVVPQLEHLVSAGIAGAHMFQTLDDATAGVLGKATLLTAALPIAA